MKPEEVMRLYDSSYAASYDQKFLETAPIDADTGYQLELLRSMLTPGVRWLDAACGTGYFLARFPESARAGLDISPAMLEIARERNPGVELRRHDFRHPLAEWQRSFDLVSCMWYAYCLVDSFDEVAGVLANLADWTADGGRLFVPLADPDLIARTTLPDRLPYGPTGGDIRIEGIVWSFVDEEGTKHHRNLVSPSIAWMREEIGRYFDSVETLEFPPVNEFVGRRPALIASGKRIP